MTQRAIISTFAAAVCVLAGAAVMPAPARAVSFVDQQVEANILLLQGYINAQGEKNGFVYPSQGLVKKGGGLPAPIWPANPWTGTVMAPGTRRGTYTYTLASSRTSYKLVGHLSKGSYAVTGKLPPWLALERTKRNDLQIELSGSILKGYADIWGLLHGGAPPTQLQMAAGGEVGAAHPFWPVNPFTGAAMAQGTTRGDFGYAPGVSGSYTLAAHLSGGTLFDLSGTVP